MSEVKPSESRNREFTAEQLRAWIQERLDNCHNIAVHRDGADRDGWLEDAAYFAAVLRSLVASETATKISEGWKLVPEEPTTEMKLRGSGAFLSIGTATAGAIYRAMVAAAPKVPTPDERPESGATGTESRSTPSRRQRMSSSQDKPRSKSSRIVVKRHAVPPAVVCNLAAWFGIPDVGYQPHYGRKKRK